MTRIDALKAAIEIAGGQAQLAAILGKSQQLVSYWITSGKGAPSEFVLQIERETRVPRWFLRPDIYPADLGAGPKAERQSAAA